MDPLVDPLDDDLVTFTAPAYAAAGANAGPETEPGYRFVAPGELPWPTRHDEAGLDGFWDEADDDRRSRPPRVRRTSPRSYFAAGSGSGPRRPVAVVVVLSAVLAIGFGIGRLSAGSSGRATPGPAARDGAVPAGFAQTREGATAAAADYAALIATPALADPASMSATLAAIAAPGADFGDAAASAVDGLAARLAESGVKLDDRVTFRTFPLTARVRRYSESFAEVEVWAASVLAVDGTRPAGAAFVTYRFSLTWSASDWRVEDLTVRPTPPEPATPSELVDFPSLEYAPVAYGRTR